MPGKYRFAATKPAKRCHVLFLTLTERRNDFNVRLLIKFEVEQVAFLGIFGRREPVIADVIRVKATPCLNQDGQTGPIQGDISRDRATDLVIVGTSERFKTVLDLRAAKADAFLLLTVCIGRLTADASCPGGRPRVLLAEDLVLLQALVQTLFRVGHIKVIRESSSQVLLHQQLSLRFLY